MMCRLFVRIACAVVLASAVHASAVFAQPRPSAAVLAMAKELVELKGGTVMFDPVVDGVIRSHKNFMLQSNPNMGRDLDEIEGRLRTEYAPKKVELQAQIALAYAQFFTEQELKDALAFYKTPLGKKLISEEPKVVETSMKLADQWADKFANEVQQRLRAELRKKGLNPI